MDNVMKRTKSNLFDYQEFIRIIDQAQQNQDNDKGNSLQQLLNHTKCKILNHHSQQIEGLCVNEECRAQNRGTCQNCIIQGIHQKDEQKQQTQSNKPIDANQLKNIIKTFLIYFNKQIDYIEYCFYFEQIELTDEDNEKIACFKIQELEKIENQIIQLKEINQSINTKDYIHQQQTTNIGLSHFLQKYYKEVYKINKNIDDYIQSKKELTSSSNFIKQVKFNVNDIDRFHALKKKKNYFIHKISQSIYILFYLLKTTYIQKIRKQMRKIKNLSHHNQKKQVNKEKPCTNKNNMNQRCNVMNKRFNLILIIVKLTSRWETCSTIQGDLKRLLSCIIKPQHQIQNYILLIILKEVLLIIQKDMKKLSIFMIQLYNQIHNVHKHIIIYHTKGNSLYNLQKYELAIQIYDKVIQLSPKYSQAYYNKGNSLDDLQKYEEAIQMYDVAIQLNPKFSEAYNNKGISLKNLQRYEEAIKMYDQAIQLNPSYSQAYNNKGISLKNLKKYEEAIQMYEKAILINPEDSKAYFNKGISLKNLQRHLEAELLLRKAKQTENN